MDANLQKYIEDRRAGKIRLNSKPLVKFGKSARDRLLERTFKMYVNQNLYTEDEWHDFCNFAKGKPESALITHMNKYGVR